jgi:thiamine-monophosphate kinase
LVFRSSWFESDGGSNPEIGDRAPEVGPATLKYYDDSLPLSEKLLLGRLRRRSRSGPQVKVGMGDDCAVLQIPAGEQAILTTDLSLEGIHFRRDWHSPPVVGHRCLTRGLSDIAAMGGMPLAAFVSLALPKKLPQAWVNGFYRGLLKLAEAFSVSLAGGDTAESPAGVMADIVVVGRVPEGRAILRSGARPGDRIYVTGSLGGSAATIDLLLSRPRHKLRPQLFAAHFFPTPRVRVGQALRERNLVSAMIDLSDGLSTDLSHLCEESGVGAEIDAEAIPCASLAQPARAVALHFALHGGEDYELLFTSPRGKAVPPVLAGVKLTLIGTITRSREMTLRRPPGRGVTLHAQGWEHFKK